MRSYRALASWVSRGGRKGISPTKAEARRKQLDVRAHAILQVFELRSGLLSAQEELSQAIAERRARGAK